MAMALAMLPTLAQGSRQVITTPDGKQYCLTSSQPDIKWEQRGDTWRPVKKAPQKTEPTEGAVTVTIESIFGDMEDVYLECVQLLDEQGNNTLVEFENSFATSPGTYDMLVRYSSYDMVNERSLFYCLLKEEIVISNDMTITFDIAEATQLINVSDHHPNGELFTGHDNYGIVMIESGLCRKNDEGCLYMITSNTFAGNLPKTYINQISNRFGYYQGNCYVSEDWSPDPEAYITFYTSNDLTHPLENDANDYRLISERFTPSKVSQQEAESKGIGSQMRIMFGEKLISEVGTGKWIDDLSVCDVNLYVNIPEVASDFSGIYALVGPVMTDYLEIVGYLPWGEPRYQSHQISAPVLAMNQGDVTYLNLGMGAIESLFLNDGQEVKYPYGRGLHPFYFTPAQKEQDFASAVPIIMTPGFYRGIIGRYGERRDVDLRCTVNLTLKKNGEEVWHGQMMDYGQNEFLNKEPLGIIEGLFDDDNVIVDELQGRNLTTIHYDESLDDNMVPTMTMLWFKDTNDKATDRFGNASDGILEFSAGDFIFNENPETYNIWLTCQPMSSVEVSYSPYQADTWNELAVDEVPENFCSPGYGYFYRGSLAGVTGEALNGWFDLKVKLTDAAGNWQEQVISPAFRIDDLAYTSVATVGSDNAREVARFSIDGKRVDATHRGVTIIRMSDGTTKKIVQ